MYSAEEGNNIYDSERDDSQSSSESSIQTWISWFCSLLGHEFYIEVPEEFIDDEFNLTGLSSIVPYYTQALETILDIESGEFFEDEDEEEEEEEYDLSQIENYYNNNTDDFWKESSSNTPMKRRLKSIDPRIVEPYAFMLYGLIHQRYLLTTEGIRIMVERYSYNEFGVCPRYYCNENPVLPIGKFDETGRESVHLYCPKCHDIYIPPNSIHQRVDGAHFGSSYPQLLFFNHPKYKPSPTSHIYEPSIFGFKVSPISRSGPQNQWLRKFIIDHEEQVIKRPAAAEEEQDQLSKDDSLTQQINKLHIYDK